MVEVPFYQGLQDGYCGPAAMQMAYETFNIKVSQEDIWSKTHTDSITCKTTDLMLDAMTRGLTAMGVVLKNPAMPLKPWLDCYRLIPNYRGYLNQGRGHFGVIVDQTPESYVIHDPFTAGAFSFCKDYFLELWEAKYDPCEIYGHLLIVLSDQVYTGGLPGCEVCGTHKGVGIYCNYCEKVLPSFPDILGCSNYKCERSTWVDVICPYCNKFPKGPD